MNLTRFERQLRIIGEELQRRIRHYKVAIFGIGGLGSYVSYLLTCLGVGELVLVDFDRVSIPDLNRQILYDYQSVGIYKTIIAYRKLSKFVNDTSICCINTKIFEDSGLIHEIVKKVDIIFDCLDNIDSRLVINDLCLRYRKPMIHGGVSELRGQVIFLPGDGPCLRCILRTSRVRRVEVLAFTCSLTASLQVREFLEYVKGRKEPRAIFVDLEKPTLRTFRIDRLKECESCKYLT